MAPILLFFVGLVVLAILIAIVNTYRTRSLKKEEHFSDGLNNTGKNLTCSGLITRYEHHGDMCGFPCMRDGSLNVPKRLHFADPSLSTRPDMSKNNSDPYFMQKIIHGRDKSSLRLTINDNADETFQIWGNSCRTTGCHGDGVKQHQFRADGRAWHRGRGTFDGGLRVKGNARFGVRGTRARRFDVYHRWGNSHFPWRNGWSYIRGNGLRVDCPLQIRKGNGIDMSRHYGFENTEQDRGYPDNLVGNGRTVLRWDRNNTGSKAKEFKRSGAHGRNATFYYKDPDSGEFRYLLDTGNVKDLKNDFIKKYLDSDKALEEGGGSAVSDDDNFITKKIGGYSSIGDQIILLCRYGAINNRQQNVIGTMYHNRTTGWNTGIIMNIVYSQSRRNSGGRDNRYTAALNFMGGNRGGINASLVRCRWNGTTWVGIRIRARSRYWSGDHYFSGYNTYRGNHQFRQIRTSSASSVRNLRTQAFESQGSIKTSDKLCINGTCLDENDLKVLKGERPFTMRSNRTGRRLQDGNRNARFRNTNRQSWEWMYLEGR